MLDFLRLQKEQHLHDLRNHLEILSLSKMDRLKHYGLHFCKYAGRLARGRSEAKSITQTITDTALVSLSAANTLHLNLETKRDLIVENCNISPSSALLELVDASGRFADACEKIDHMEDFLDIAKLANLDIVSWVVSASRASDINLDEEISARRETLAYRHFFI